MDSMMKVAEIEEAEKDKMRNKCKKIIYHGKHHYYYLLIIIIIIDITVFIFFVSLFPRHHMLHQQAVDLQLPRADLH